MHIFTEPWICIRSNSKVVGGWEEKTAKLQKWCTVLLLITHKRLSLLMSRILFRGFSLKVEIGHFIHRLWQIS
jgi:hypothetical protein